MPENALCVKKEFAGILFPAPAVPPEERGQEMRRKNPVFVKKTGILRLKI
jgi:hypothetical protein